MHCLWLLQPNEEVSYILQNTVTLKYDLSPTYIDLAPRIISFNRASWLGLSVSVHICNLDSWVGKPWPISNETPVYFYHEHFMQQLDIAPDFAMADCNILYI